MQLGYERIPQGMIDQLSQKRPVMDVAKQFKCGSRKLRRVKEVAKIGRRNFRMYPEERLLLRRIYHTYERYGISISDIIYWMSKGQAVYVYDSNIKTALESKIDHKVKLPWDVVTKILDIYEHQEKRVQHIADMLGVSAASVTNILMDHRHGVLRPCVDEFPSLDDLFTAREERMSSKEYIEKRSRRKTTYGVRK